MFKSELDSQSLLPFRFLPLLNQFAELLVTNAHLLDHWHLPITIDQPALFLLGHPLASRQPLKLLFTYAEPLPIHILEKHERAEYHGHGLAQHRIHRLLHVERIDESHYRGEVGDAAF